MWRTTDDSPYNQYPQITNPCFSYEAGPNADGPERYERSWFLKGFP